MNNLVEIEDKLSQRFFSDYDLEKEIIDAALNCRTRDSYLELLQMYSLGKMRDVCCQTFGSQVDPKRVFRNLKSCHVFVDFI